MARAADVENVLATLRLEGDGYGPSSSEGLSPLVTRLLKEGAIRGPLLETRSARGVSHPPAIKAVALTGFVTLEQARAWIAKPPDHLVDHVFAREGAGEAVLLRPEQIGALNAREGLGLVFIAFRLAPADEEEAGVLISWMFDGFRLFHAGYFCPLALHPSGNTARADDSLDRLGFRTIGDSRSVRVLETAKLDDAPFNPFIVLRRRTPPRFGFSLGEKDVLQRALLGATDTEVAEDLHISLETVRKRWRSIFERVAAREEPKILPPANVDDLKRGPEKRGAVLQYIDAHLEELRPYETPRP
jgi:DNA-binding CsgD family transcriptional regulator